jgi:hypothetical protein
MPYIRYLKEDLFEEKRMKGRKNLWVNENLHFDTKSFRTIFMQIC